MPETVETSCRKPVQDLIETIELFQRVRINNNLNHIIILTFTQLFLIFALIQALAFGGFMF